MLGMDAERARSLLLGLPHVVEVEQWGGLLFWVGDKAVGGKTFAMVNLEAGGGNPIAFSCGPERFDELCENEGIIPAPYFRRAFWVAAERWDALRNAEWEGLLRAAHSLTLAKLPARTQALLALPAAERKRLIAERKKALAAKPSKPAKA